MYKVYIYIKYVHTSMSKWKKKRIVKKRDRSSDRFFYPLSHPSNGSNILCSVNPYLGSKSSLLVTHLGDRGPSYLNHLLLQFHTPYLRVDWKYSIATGTLIWDASITSVGLTHCTFTLAPAAKTVFLIITEK